MDEAKIFTNSILQVLPCFFISFSIKTTFSFYKLLKTAKKNLQNLEMSLNHHTNLWFLIAGTSLHLIE